MSFCFSYCFLLILVFLPFDVQALRSSVNINCGGDSSSKFTSDLITLDWLQIWGNPSISKNKYRKVFGAEPENEPSLYSHRWKKGSFGYVIYNMNPGKYECTLHFVETSQYYASPRKRVFSATINGKSSGEIDVFRSVGKMYVSYTKTVKHINVHENNKRIDVNLMPIFGDAMISAISCQKEESTDKSEQKLNSEFMINAGGETFVLHNPVVPFVSDLYNSKPNWVALWGKTRIYKEKASSFDSENYSDDLVSLIQSERFSPAPSSSFGYVITKLQPGFWQCYVGFSETYWNYPGKRIIRLKVNGIERWIDVYKSVGKYRKYSEWFDSFYVKDKIQLSFHRHKGDPMVSYIYCSRDVHGN